MIWMDLRNINRACRRSLLDIRNVVGNVLVFEAPNREVVEKFHANDPYTLEDMFEIEIIKPLWQRVPALD